MKEINELKQELARIKGEVSNCGEKTCIMTVSSMNNNDLELSFGIGTIHEQTWLHFRVL